MRRPLISLALAAGLAASALAQTQVLFRIEKPQGAHVGWGTSVSTVGDLDGDGQVDLAVGSFNHGGGVIASTHSGATGALLYTIEVPFAPQFYRDSLESIGDLNGDGVPDLALVASNSGDSASTAGWIDIHSGLDGRRLHRFNAPTGVVFGGLAQVLDDADGDGVGDVLCNVKAPMSSLVLLSSATGDLLFTVAPGAMNRVLVSEVVRTPDFDGDGGDDFAFVTRDDALVHRLELRSGMNGALIVEHASPGLKTMTHNGEPLITTADADGDGLRDFAIGGVFTGLVYQYSSSTGQRLRKWDCSTQNVPCFGSTLIEVDDINGDGHPDLLASETSLDSSLKSMFGLDPLTGRVLFEDKDAGIPGGWTLESQVVPLPQANRQALPTFAILDQQAAPGIVVRQMIPALGFK